MNLNIDNLIPEEYYYYKYKDGKWQCIFRFKEKRNDTNDLRGFEYIETIRDRSFSSSLALRSNEAIELRKATYSEINWLKEAVKANKYVECPTIEENVLNNIQIW